ncbi:MAG TPA: hypothetical protein VNT60_07970 [Deinococcales bacterium]|nr:hypothetical protein [Deinococcales bacterium]
MPNTSPTAECRWVPGTMDKVRLTHAPAGTGARVVEAATVSLDNLLHAVPAAVRSLYLSGRAHFPCDESLWKRLTTRKNH